MLTVERVQEHWAGFSINALGFAGYLLITEGSDTGWLHGQGPWALLRAVAAP
jgi:ATP adenylyltransferase